MGSTYFKKRCIAAFGKAKKGWTKPKAFKSEEKANLWAKEKGLKDFKVEAIGKTGKKFKIRNI